MIVLSRGKCGDIIAQCCLARQKYEQTGEKLQIYCRQHKPFKKGQLEWLEPLLKLQPYFDKCGWVDQITDVHPQIPQLQQISIKIARQLARQFNYYSAWWVDEQSWWRQIPAVHRETDLRWRIPLAYKEPLQEHMDPWITVPPHRHIQQPYIVLSVTPRYRCCTNFQELKKYKGQYRILFLGHRHDYEAFASGVAQYYPVQDIVHAAQVIQGAELYIGVQTLFTWLAEAMGVNRICATSPKFKDTKMLCNRGFKAQFLHPAQFPLILQQWEAYKGKQSSVGYVISTYGSPAYVQLQLALHKGKWGHDVIVSDDGSHDAALKLVCAKWDVPLIGCDQPRLGHQDGDLAAYKRAVQHFRNKDWVVKLSRRFVWTQDLQYTLRQYDTTLCKPCLTAWWVPKPMLQNQAITTSCIAFNVGGMPKEILDTLGQQDRGTLYMQKYLFRWLAQFYGPTPFTLWQEVYVAPGRCRTADSILWHEKSAPQQYYALAQSLGLQGSSREFQDIRTE